MNVIELKNKIFSAGSTFESLSAFLGMNISTFYRKINGKSDFTRNEIILISSYLGLSNNDVFIIFFANELA